MVFGLLVSLIIVLFSVPFFKGQQGFIETFYSLAGPLEAGLFLAFLLLFLWWPDKSQEFLTWLEEAYAPAMASGTILAIALLMTNQLAWFEFAFPGLFVIGFMLDWRHI